MISYSHTRPIAMRLKSESLLQLDYGQLVQKRSTILCADAFECSFSIVILGYDEGDACLRLLESVYESTMKSKFEVIFVDNGLSQDIVDCIVSHDWQNFIYIKLSKNVGCSAGRNIGALEARGDYIVFLDSDGIVDFQALEEMQRRMSSCNAVALRGKVIPISQGDDVYIPQHYDLGNEKLVSFIDAEGISAWRREPFLRSGGFEDSLAGGEGVVLCYRMCEFYGYSREQFLYFPDIILKHDFAFDQEKLRYKITQREIFARQRILRYPFINDFIAYYTDKRSHLSVNSKEMEESIGKIAAQVRPQRKNVEEFTKYDEMSRSEKVDFSVVIPCYNLGKHIMDAVASVRSQTLQGVEIIIVDDASPDQHTQEVLNRMEDDITLIKLEENGGVSRARNAGISQASGEYILCLDADDTIMPEYLEKAKNVFDADNGVDIVSCHAQVWGGKEWVWKADDKLPIQEALMRSPIHTASTFRKSAHDQGGGYDEQLRGYEDWDHWLRIMKQGGTVRVIPDILFRYYVRSGSKVNTSNRNAVELVQRIVNNHRELYEENVDKIFAQRHYEWVMRDARLQELESIVASHQLNDTSNSENLLEKITRYKKKFFPRKL